MKKENMLTYLEKQLDKQLGEYDFAIDWDGKNHSIEIIVVLYAQNQESLSVEDLEGVVSEEEIIEFEDSILLYNPEKTTFEADNYLATIPYEGKKGMEKRVIDLLAKHLNEVLTEGESDLIDFLQDEEAEFFELVWNQSAFEEQVQEIKGTTEYVAYPKY